MWKSYTQGPSPWLWKPMDRLHLQDWTHLHLHLPQSTIFQQQNTILSRFYCYKKPRLGLTIHSHCLHPDTQTFMKIGKSLVLNKCQYHVQNVTFFSMMDSVEQRRNELTMNLAKSSWIKLVKMKPLFPYPCPRIQIIIKLQELTLKKLKIKRRMLKLKDS